MGNILTRFALSLLVDCGHKTCKKAKRIQHGMEKKQKEEEETAKKKEKMNVDDDEDAKMETESVASFESDADDVIIWQPQWVVLLNAFGNDQSPSIRMTARRVKTVFMDWEEHKAARKSWVSQIVENK